MTPEGASSFLTKRCIKSAQKFGNDTIKFPISTMNPTVFSILLFCIAASPVKMEDRFGLEEAKERLIRFEEAKLEIVELRKRYPGVEFELNKFAYLTKAERKNASPFFNFLQS